MKKLMSNNQGFTLIELIVVIVILGIMAAIAVPKFVDLQSDARVSVIRGVEGSIRSAATLVYSKSLIDGTEALASSETPPPTVTIPTGTVTINFGYPTATAAGIGAIVDIDGAPSITHNGTGTYSYNGRTNCQVVYTAAANATTPPTIVPTTDGC
ncbi:prepilin-type N-terminal cleavage/methylation domain-containing protein [Aliikangiella maris]|uniref:Prepilin-type N-terminal cleavage/methylation domain-containing protein n=2 Tax=Aliikangiella maris TaxID=3162458 RepID=A0ABV3MQE9_9GAMM